MAPGDIAGVERTILMKRLAVDTGGTFTDIVYIDDEAGTTILDKVPTTPRDLGEGVLEAIKKTRVDLSEISLFIHGTTAGLNTIAERRGARVGLITTRGFADIVELTTSGRKEVYNYLWKKPEPLVPRYLRRGVNERTDHRGEVLRPPDPAEVKDIAASFQRAGVEAVAVCLLHAYANPENELKIREMIAGVWPEAGVSLSHQVACELGENVRTNTTIISAYMGKAITGYVDRLSEKLKELGFRGQLLILGPSGVMGIEAARQKPLYSLASGPVGGAAGAAHLARLGGNKNVVTMDVGGTSFDVAIIRDGVNLERHESELLGYPVLRAGIDIRSIGAGGGSLARVDAAGLLTVGPESAGADPGPMAYGRGGREPTVTDAALVNGLINPDYFIGGEMRLDMELARQGVGGIAARLGLDLHQAADGILAVARNNMTTATTEVLIGQGFDPRDFTIMGYGGGGGIFVAAIARDMSISRVVIPPAPGVFSARGIMAMDLVHTYARAYTRPMDGLDIRELESVFAAMEKDAFEILSAEGMSHDEIIYQRSLDMGYESQHYHIETPVSGIEMKELAGEKICACFEGLHEARYGHRVDAPLVVTNVRLKATGRIKDVPVAGIQRGREIPPEAVKPSRRVFLDGGFVDAGIYERDRLRCGNVVTGPAIVEEPFHTTVVMPGQTLELDEPGNLIIRTGGA
jgi:N-methylhydantoinase A